MKGFSCQQSHRISKPNWNMVENLSAVFYGGCGMLSLRCGVRKLFGHSPIFVLENLGGALPKPRGAMEIRKD